MRKYKYIIIASIIFSIIFSYSIDIFVEKIWGCNGGLGCSIPGILIFMVGIMTFLFIIGIYSFFFPKNKERNLRLRRAVMASLVSFITVVAAFIFLAVVTLIRL